MVAWAGEDASVWHCTASGRDYVEGFCSAEGRAARFFADGAKGGAREEAGIVRFGGCAIGGFDCRSRGGCGLFGRRVGLGPG